MEDPGSIDEAVLEEINRLRDEICKVGHEMYKKGLITYPDGNLSVSREDFTNKDDWLYITTVTETDKRALTRDDVRLYRADGTEVKLPDVTEHRKVSKGLGMHLVMYKGTNDKARAVVHAHGPVGMEYADCFSGRGFNHPLGIFEKTTNWSYYDTAVNLARMGRVYVAGPHCSITEKEEEAVRPFVGRATKFLVPTTGSYAYSEIENDPVKALWNSFYGTVDMEDYAQQFLNRSWYRKMAWKWSRRGRNSLLELYNTYRDKAGPNALPLLDQLDLERKRESSMGWRKYLPRWIPRGISIIADRLFERT